MSPNRADTAFIRREALGVVLIICKWIAHHLFADVLIRKNSHLELSSSTLTGAFGWRTCSW